MVNAPVAAFAADALVHVNAVVEINVVGHAMDAVPDQWLPGAKTLADRLQIRTVGIKLRVAIHARFGWRHASKGRRFHGGVAIAAVDSIVSDVVLVAELDRLGNHHVSSRVPCRPLYAQ